MQNINLNKNVKFKISHFYGLLVLCLCSSCFEIIEEVSFNKDGSGKVKLTLNLSRSKTKINSLKLLDSINTYKIPSEGEIRTHFAEVIDQIKATKGIYGVSHSMNLEDYIVTLTCQFNDVEALNTVISKFSTREDVARIKSQKHFSYHKTNKTFTRNYHYDLASEFNKANMEDRKVFENASMTTIYRFQSPIAISKNKMAKISSSQTAVMLKVTAQEILKNQNSIKNQITLK